MTGDVGEDYNHFRNIKQQQHRHNYEHNQKILADSGFVLIAYPTVTHIKAPHTYVLFYPHTGRWQVKGFRNMYSGGAKKCVEWLRQIERKHALRIEDVR